MPPRVRLGRTHGRSNTPRHEIQAGADLSSGATPLNKGAGNSPRSINSARGSGESEWRRVLGRTVRRHFGDSRPLWGGLESGDESPVRRNPGHPKAIHGYVVGSRRTRTATFRGG